MSSTAQATSSTPAPGLSLLADVMAADQHVQTFSPAYKALDKLHSCLSSNEPISTKTDNQTQKFSHGPVTSATLKEIFARLLPNGPTNQPHSNQPALCTAESIDQLKTNLIDNLVILERVKSSLDQKSSQEQKK